MGALAHDQRRIRNTFPRPDWFGAPRGDDTKLTVLREPPGQSGVREAALS